MRAPRRRRRVLLATAAALAVAASGALDGTTPVTDTPQVQVQSAVHAPDPFEEIPLFADGVVLDAGGLPVLVEVGGTVADDPSARARQDTWIAEGRVPGPPEYADMAEQALRDLDALVLPNGAALAATSPYWRYVWPRDASFTAVALARTGHPRDAFDVLRYVQGMQDARSTAGVMEARYLPDGSGDVPDDRGLQLDGTGWVLWAVGEWFRATSDVVERGRVEELRPLVVRSVAAAREHRDPLTGLPSPFPDYWEVREDRPTLATAAALLAGLRAVGPVLEELGEPPVDDLVAELEAAVRDAFAPGFPRHPGGPHRDTGVAFLMPPFAPLDPQVREAWGAAADEMRRPAGGLAPGAGWKQDGISWTPETAVWALTAAASGDRRQTREWLDWLDAHRTPRGALPEKVLWDGRPSSVAPLAWTSSLVLLTLDSLERGPLVPTTF